MELNGEVGSGLNRAHKFMAQPHYQEQFEEILGYSAWPGTLNVKVDASDLGHYVALREASGIDTLDLPEHIRAQAGTTDVSIRIEAVRGTSFTGDIAIDDLGVGITVNECTNGTATCDTNATCTDTPSSYSCACNAGFTGDGQTCDDVDECALGQAGCAQACVNEVGGFRCEDEFCGDAPGTIEISNTTTAMTLDANRKRPPMSCL